MEAQFANMAAVNAVNATGVEQGLIDHVNDWRRWLCNSGDERQEFRLLWDAESEWVLVGLTRLGAWYLVECLRVYLPLETTADAKPRKTALCLGGDDISDAAITVLCDFLQRNDANLVSLHLASDLPMHQYRQVLVSMRSNTTVKELQFGHCGFYNNAEERGRLIVLLLQQKTEIKSCLNFFASTGEALVRILRLLPRGCNLQKVAMSCSSLRDDHVRSILQALNDSDFPILDDLDFSGNLITSVGLCYLCTELGPAARRRIRKLDLGFNRKLLNKLKNTRSFVQNFLLSDEMNLTDFDIAACGKHADVIIKACENGKNKLQKLNVSYQFDVNPKMESVRDQLVESWPKMKSIQHLVCDSLFFDLDNRSAMLKSLWKNRSIVEKIRLVDADDDDDSYDEIRLVIAGLIKRNQLLTLQPKTGMPIPYKSGLWSHAFSTLAPPESNDDDVPSGNAIHVGASTIFTILQQRPMIFKK